MSKRLIIAVGGSGQTVVSHYLRYATMAGMSGEALPDIYILDADLKESIREEATIPSLYGEIKKLHSRLVAGLPASNKPFLKQLYPYNSDSALTSKETFAEYLIGNRPGREDLHKQMILDGLFSVSEQELNIAEGFFARPNVGATAIFDKLNTGESDRDLNLLRQKVSHTNAPRVVVIGSTFGGTGSGGAPVIAQKLREWASDRNNIKIGVFLTLPWFSPGDLGKAFENDADTLGKWETQEKNTAAGLRFYGTSQVFLNHLDVFIADYNGEKHARKDDSNTGQPEYAHNFNIILATQIQNYLTREIPNEEKPGQYSFYYIAAQDQHRTIKIDGHDSPLLRFNAIKSDSDSNYLRQDLADWAIQTQTLRLTLAEVSKYIRNEFKLTDGSRRQRPEAFVNLTLALAKACPGIPNAVVETGIGPFRKSEAGRQIYGNLVASLTDRAEQLRGVIVWLQEAWEQSQNMPHMAPSCMARDPSPVWESYPALTGERSLEVAAIKLFHDAFDQASHIATTFQESIGNGQQEPVHAAAALIEKLLREAILSRGGHRSKGEFDEQPQTPGHGLRAAPLVPMQVHTDINNGYRVSLNLRHVLDNGPNRQGDKVSIFNEAHPATLLGVTHYNVPSPWAAAHLHAWIQMESENQALWIQTKRELEAVLWGVFSKRLKIHAVPFAELSRLGAILSGALSAELYGYSQVNHWDKIVYATATDSEGKEQTVAINHPLCGWFIAPALKGREAWWEQFDINLPSELQLTRSKGLETKQVKAFYDFLQGQLIKESHTKDSTDQAGWYRVVGKLAEALRQNLPSGVIAAGTEAIGSSFFVLDKHTGSIIPIPLMQLRHAKDQLVADYCVQTVAIVGLGEGFRVADSPLKSAYLGKSGISAEFIAQVTDSQGKSAVQYKLNLGEHGETEHVFPARLMDSFYTHTEIWPNFKTEGWQFYFLASAAVDNRSVSDYGFSVFDQSGLLLGAANRSFTHNHEISGVPEFLVMQLPKESRELGVFNFKLNPLPSGEKYLNLAIDFGTSHSCIYATQTDEAQTLILLDLSKPADSLGKPVFDYPSAKKDRIVANTEFLPCYSAVPKQVDISVLPSEFRMINEPKTGDINTGVKSFVIIPMSFEEKALEGYLMERKYSLSSILLGGFKWPGALNGTSFELQEAGLTRLYLRQLLLMSMAMLKTMGYSRCKMIRATYPEAFSYSQRLNYAETVAETLQKVVSETGFSYVGSGVLEKEQLMRIASSELTSQQREGLAKDSSGLVSESIAALLSTDTSEYNFRAERGICIVLDMGGGTTDVAAFYNPGDGVKRDASKSVDSITDSIRYAGHDLLRLLANEQIVGSILGEQWTGKKEEDCFAVLKILVRDPEYFKRLKNNFSNPQYCPEVKERMLLFFEGLFEYTRLLTLAYQKAFSGNDQRWVVNIALFGNAWKLAELVYPSREKDFDGFIKNFKSYLNAALGQNQEINIFYKTAGTISIKEAIAAGALKFNAVDRQFETPKEHASFAGLDMVSHKSDGQDVELSYDDFLSGFDQHGFDARNPLTVKSLASLQERPLMKTLRARYGKQDDEWITRQVAAAINEAIREPWLTMGGRDAMKFSPMRLFLEHVWKETVRVVKLKDIKS